MNTTALEGLDAPAVEEPVALAGRRRLDPFEAGVQLFEKGGGAPHDDCRDRRGRPARRADGALATVSDGMMRDRPNERLPDNKTWPRTVRPGPEAPAMNAQTGGSSSEPRFVQPPVDG